MVSRLTDTSDGLSRLDLRLYLICSDDRPAYVNWTSNLNDRIARHKEASGDELVPYWLLDGFGRASRISYAEFRHRPPKQLEEMRIMQVAKLKPWLNLLEAEKRFLTPFRSEKFAQLARHRPDENPAIFVCLIPMQLVVKFP